LVQATLGHRFGSHDKAVSYNLGEISLLDSPAGRASHPIKKPLPAVSGDYICPDHNSSASPQN
jgi:hypothetical protein